MLKIVINFFTNLGIEKIENYFSKNLILCLKIKKRTK